MVDRFSMNPVSCKLLNEAWKKEFPDEVAIAKRMLALLDELEHYKSREERVTKLVLDNSTSWDALYKKLEAAEHRIAEHRKVLNSLAAVARRYLPDYDEHPEIQAADELLESAAGIKVIEGEGQ
ncbi:ead/Ea22-like family protein [Salmonella enterica]|nr:ead/Ea22-like family protein [Salmonella enterica]